MPKTEISERRKKPIPGANKKGTAIDSLSRREMLEIGFPVKDPKTGKVSVRRIKTSRGGGLVNDSLAAIKKAVKKAVAKGHKIAPHPKKQSGKISPEHGLSDTRRAVDFNKHRNKR